MLHVHGNTHHSTSGKYQRMYCSANTFSHNVQEFIVRPYVFGVNNDKNSF